MLVRVVSMRVVLEERCKTLRTGKSSSNTYLNSLLSVSKIPLSSSKKNVI